MPRIVYIAAAFVSGTLLVFALMSVFGGGISDRAVAEFGEAPEAASPAADPAPIDISGFVVPEAGPVPVPVKSGYLDAVENDEGIIPVRIVVGDVEIDAPVHAMGVDTERNEMEVPQAAEVVGWYRYGPSPGEEGSAVLAAHVDYNGREGAFYDLFQVEAGTLIKIEYSDGSYRLFETFAQRSYEKEVLPVESLFGETGTPRLALITCGGDFDRGSYSYDSNVVVYAEPVGPIHPPSEELAPA
jgi:hypothetical protein